MSLILAIDQSTSATKAMLFDTSGGLVDKASLSHKQIYPQPGWVEHDAEEIWQNTLAALNALLEKNRGRVNEIACLSLTNQRETVIVFDRATGKPLQNGIVWQCRRGAPFCEELVRAGHDEKIRGLTGLKVDTYFSASKLTWLGRNRPELRAKLASGDALIGTIDTYLIYRLTGCQDFATDHTNASRTLLYDITKLRWDDGLCEIFEVPMRALPETRDCSARFGETNLGGLLSKPIPICGVIGDAQSSLFAQRCFKIGEAKMTIGTGSTVMLNLGGTPRFSEGGAVTTIAWAHSGKPTYCFEGITNYSAASVEWLKNQLGLITSAKEIGPLAAAVPDNGGVYLVPAFAGLSAPYWKPDARAAIVGLSAHSTRQHVARAVEESIAYQLRDVLDMMKQDAGMPLTRALADGGATGDRFLMQFVADMTGLEVLVSNVAECSPLGAALLGGLGVGVFSSLEQLASLPRETTAFRATMNAKSVENYYAGWKQAVKRVL
jgi:glycerol kinase